MTQGHIIVRVYRLGCHALVGSRLQTLLKLSEMSFQILEILVKLGICSLTTTVIILIVYEVHVASHVQIFLFFTQLSTIKLS